MGLGVTRYCTPESGSGFVVNSQLPWLSTFDWYQLNPVYDQTTEWMRNQKPGSYTGNFPRFGPPYSLDGGTQPPFASEPMDANDLPVPIETECGMGDLTLLRSQVVAPMPSITSTARYGCIQENPCAGQGVSGWVEENPWLAAAIALGVGYVLFSGGRR